MGISLKSIGVAILHCKFIEEMLTDMTEGRMPEVVSQTSSLNHFRMDTYMGRYPRIVLDASFCEAPTYLRYFESVLLACVKDLLVSGPYNLGNAG